MMLFSSLFDAGPTLTERVVEPLTLRTRRGVYVLAVEVAETERQKALGLMFRAEVPPGTGMLFPHPAPQEITMWMQNTFVSLDLVFIRGNGRVHRVERNTEPMSEAMITSAGAVTAVLEVAAGEADRLGIAPGDEVVFRSFR